MCPGNAAERHARLLSSALQELVARCGGLWLLDACGVTRATRSIPALLHADAYDRRSTSIRVLLIGGVAGRAGDIDLVFRILDSYLASSELQSRIALSAVPCDNPGGLELGVGPENGSGGNPGAAAYPPAEGYFNHPENPEARYLWRWTCQQGPDLVIEVREGASLAWEANGAASVIAGAFGPARLAPAGSLIHAMGDPDSPGPGVVPGLRLTTDLRHGIEAIGQLWRVLSGWPAPVRSPAGVALAHRSARPPLEIARLLAGAYGRRLDPVVYTQGVGISGRLRLSAVERIRGGTALEGREGDGSDDRDIASIVEPYARGERQPFKDNAGGQDLAGVVWAEELYERAGERRHLELIVNAADRFRAPSRPGLPPPPADPDFRTEDVFFTSAVLGRAFRMTGDTKYVDVLATYLTAVVERQRPDGLFWHCGAAPYYWGRGNGFAALGFAEALTYLPGDRPERRALIESHRRHLDALARTQAPSGMLRQVLDFPGSYEELSATCMAGYAIARGIRLGWLDPAHFRPMLDRLWTAAAEHIDGKGRLVDVCTGTGVQPDLRAYLDRAAISGYDDRGGSLALWFAVEMASCILSPT